VPHCASCFVSHSSESESYLVAHIGSAIIEIDAGANLAFVIEQERSLFSVAKHVGKRKS